MSKPIADFVKRMEEQGRSLEVHGNFVVITPSAGLAISDMMQMQKLNKKGELAEYVTNSGKGAAK